MSTSRSRCWKEKSCNGLASEVPILLPFLKQDCKYVICILLNIPDELAGLAVPWNNPESRPLLR